jgi:uncharacterized protein (TIGR01777 family)
MENSEKKIIIPGGSGFLGMALAKHYVAQNYRVIVLSRSEKQPINGIEFAQWDGKKMGSWSELFENAEAIINMAGRTVDCRYTEQNKAQILNSRIDSTKIVGKAIQQCQNPPKVWLNSSSATIYKGTKGKAQTESEGEIGDDFSMNICKAWEKAFFELELPNTRRVAMRTSIVLGKEGDATKILMKLAKFGLGGKQGSGEQFFSWLHINDFIEITDSILRNPQLEGVVNCVAPNPVTNSQQMEIIRKAVGVPFGLPSTEWMLEIGAFFLGTETELVLKSRKVFPEKLLNTGYQFEYEKLENAMAEIVS